jgi:hypothetical protein
MGFGSSKSQSSSQGSSQGSSNTYTASRKDNKMSPLFLKILIWVIYAIIGAFIFANIKPYEIIAANYFANIDYKWIADILTNIPFLGGIFKLIFSLFNFGVGVLLWAFVQMLELLPLVLFGHGEFLDNSIQRSNGKRYGVNQNDAWEVKTAKKIGNSLNTEVLRFIILLGISVYVADFFLCLSVFPPVKGDANFLTVLQTGQYSKIDWWNILKAISTVGAVEMLIKLKMLLGRIAEDLRT